MKIPLKGPRLVDVAVRLIRERGLTGIQVAERYGVGATWLSDVERGYVESPRADVIQMIIEDLTGKPLV